MNYIFTDNGVSIGRDATDKRVPKETTIVHRLLLALNEGRRGVGPWVRFNPSLHGMTGCTLGVRNTRTGVVYWHGNYQVESAHEAFNKMGSVFFNKA